VPDGRAARSSRHRAAAPGLALLALLATASPGCKGRPGQIEIPPLPKVRDAAAELTPIPDGARLCVSDLDCDDQIACTRDLCVLGRYCVSSADSSRCSDGVFCNGEEVCDPAMGCRDGTPERCADDDVCTVDACDEDNKRCRHDPRDFDGDGEADWHCAGGTDCDDFDPTTGSTASEICGDGVDNDCDDKVDEDDCVRSMHDRCEDALEVSSGGAFLVDLAGATPNYASSCSAPAARDVAFTFVLTEAKDVTVSVNGLLSDGSDETASVSVRTDCSDITTEKKCSHGFPAQVRLRALPPGRYFAIASSDVAARVVLSVSFDPPSEAPTNTTCEHPLDISAGGRFEGNFVDAGDDEQVACGFPGAEDLIYQFTLDEERDVELSAVSLSQGRMNLAVRSDCHDPSTTLRCVSDAPARARLYQLPKGTYYVVLEGPQSREVDFGLDVAFVDPTPPPPGDGCGDPIDLALGTEVNATLANRQDFIDVQCRCSASADQTKQTCEQHLADAVYRVQIDHATDLRVSLDGGESLMVYAFRSSCDLANTQLACGVGTVLDGRVRNLQPGDYYMIFESAAPASQPANFTVQLDPLPRTVPVPVSGNDTCASAADIPADGGLFLGDTLTMQNDYQAVCGGGTQSADAAFKLDLMQRARVTATLEGSFDTVIYRYADDGDGPASCRAKREASCNDDGTHGNTNSVLADVLDPGVYYYIVDGFNDDNQGSYLLDVTIVPQ
jgi:hypothetical protein